MTTNDVLQSTVLGPWTMEAIRADAVERVIPLTRPGLPEQLQGLFWMDQWGFASHSDIGSVDCLDKIAGNYEKQTECYAVPDLLASFAGMPFEDEGDNRVTLLPVLATDVPNWVWFGAKYETYKTSFKPDDPPQIYKFVFNKACTEAVIISSASMKNPTYVSYTMVQVDANTWTRKSFLTPNHVGPSFDYTVHRIVDGEGRRLPKYDDYLTLAKRPVVSGAIPGSVTIFRRPGATDNSAIVGLLPAEGAWPAPQGHLAEFVEDALGTLIAGLLKRVRNGSSSSSGSSSSGEG